MASTFAVKFLKVNGTSNSPGLIGTEEAHRLRFDDLQHRHCA